MLDLDNAVQNKQVTMCKFNQQVFVLDARAIAFWPAQSCLIVSDLHLEKGSYYSRFASPLPGYDSIDTLLRLQKVIHEYHPKHVVCLGDSFHDINGFERLSSDCKALLISLCQGVERWTWILGNHDPALSSNLPGNQLTELKLASIWLRHEPEETSELQCIGHFHPKASITVRRQKVTGKTFVVAENLMIMPAFGSYTGGLNVENEAIKSLFNSERKTINFLITQDHIYSLGR